MPKVIKESDTVDMPEAITRGRYYFYCPACYENAKALNNGTESYWILRAIHCFSTDVHQFDGNFDAPTISPSFLLTYDYGEERKPYCCHSFVNAGKIQYLSDCTHSLAGQTVDLMDVPPIPNGGKEKPGEN